MQKITDCDPHCTPDDGTNYHCPVGFQRERQGDGNDKPSDAAEKEKLEISTKFHVFLEGDDADILNPPMRIASAITLITSITRGSRKYSAANGATSHTSKAANAACNRRSVQAVSNSSRPACCFEPAPNQLQGQEGINQANDNRCHRNDSEVLR